MQGGKEAQTYRLGKGGQGIESPFSVTGKKKGKEDQALHHEGKGGRGEGDTEEGNFLPELNRLGFKPAHLGALVKKMR